MISMKVKGHVGKVIELYTGKKLINLECVPNPDVKGVFAFKATYENGDAAYFLTRHAPLADIQFADLEEVEFATWPPTSM